MIFFLQDFKPPVDVSVEDVKRVREMLCEYILKETTRPKGKLLQWCTVSLL
jgi:hypothetical protein